MMEIKYADLVQIIHLARSISDADFREVYIYVELDNNNRIWWTSDRKYLPTPDRCFVITLQPQFAPSS